MARSKNHCSARRFVGEVGCLGLLRCLAQVGGGELEAVEEESGAARVDVVGGDADEELAERFLDVVVAGGSGEREGAAAGDSLVRANDGAAGVMVEVAELLVAHARASAAVVVGEDVVALELVVGLVVVDGGFVHGYPPLFLAKSSKQRI